MANKTAPESYIKRFGSEFHEHSKGEPVLDLAQIRSEATDERTGRAGVAAERSDSAGTREIRHICRAVVELQAEGGELRRHVVVGRGAVPGFEFVARASAEIWRSGKRGCSVDRR